MQASCIILRSMKTLFHPEDKAEIVRRLQSVSPSSPRQWGKMSAHQMVCHLSDSFRGVMGEKFLSRMPGPYPRQLMKWLALYVPLRWPKGVKTRPEMDQEIGGTPPADFEADMLTLRKLLDRFTSRPRDFDWSPHPMFGPMSDADWMRWGYLHTDHHLRQFGA